MARGDIPARLPLRCTMEADESLSGLVQRLALRNGMGSAGEVLRLAGIGSLPLLDPSTDELERLAAVSGVDIGQLAMAVLRTDNEGSWVNGFLMDGVSLPREWLLPGLRICPACLADSPHHRRRWHLGALGACPDHGEHLIAKCPGCRAGLTWHRRLLPHCHCGADLRRQASGDAASDEADGWLADLGRGRRGPRLLAAWPFVPAVEFAAAVGEVLLGKRAGVALVAPAGVGVGCLQAGYRALDGDMERLDLTIQDALDGPGAVAVYGGLSRLLRATPDIGGELLVPFSILFDLHFRKARKQVMAAVPGSPLGEAGRR